MRKLGLVLGLLSLFGCLSFNAYSAEKTIGVWMSSGGPNGIWEKSYNGNMFPVEVIAKDCAYLGVTDIFFFHETGQGFLHQTEVKHAVTAPPRRMTKGRDFLKELLEETEKYNIKVWLNWSAHSNNPEIPLDFYPNKNRKLKRFDLTSSAVKNYYCNVIDEIAKKYMSKYKNIAGIFWHELDINLVVDDHSDELVEFSDFCKENFGEEYKGSSMAIKVNPKDKWWRRLYLYKTNVMNSFVQDMANYARKHNLKTGFCFYTPEAYASSSPWRWGYNAIDLERICDNIWVSGSFQLPSSEAGKPYQSFKGVWLDFCPSYKGQNLSRNYSYAFHGAPVSYFEYRSPVYIKEVRKHYLSSKSFTERYGDFYTGYIGRSKKEVSLFVGKKNMRNWLNLMSSWQPGESPAKITVAINPSSFVMQYPTATGIKYKQKITNFMELLTQYCDIDAMVTGSLRMKENLERYKLIIIPSDMGTGLDKKSYSLYLSYVKKGGKLFIINTPISTGKEDLTDLTDKTEELCGIEIKGKNLPGYVSIKSDISYLSAPKKKIWAETSKIETKGAEILVKEKYTDVPLLTRHKIGKGEVIFSALGFNPDITSYFVSVMKFSIINFPISLENNKGMRILEAVKKDDSLCISLWGKGTSILKVDTNLIGLKGKVFQVKDIVTGKIIKKRVYSKNLLTGIPVEIKYLNQPYILGIGTKKDLAAYQGIYQTEEVFKGMAERAIENPEVPILVPPGKGIKVGVYHGGIGAEPIIEVLKNENIRVFSLPRMDTQSFSYCDVVIIPQCRAYKFFNQAINDIRKYVNDGGGVLLTHDAVGFRHHSEIPFSEIGEGVANHRLDKVKVMKNHPITEGLKKSEFFTHAYYDHVAIAKGGNVDILINDEENNTVVIAGKLGKGKVVLNGMITGYATKGGEKEPTGGELKLLVNAVKWLGEK